MYGLSPLGFISVFTLFIVFFSSLHAEKGRLESSADVPENEFVEIIRIIPNVLIELPYATEDNFFKRRFYESNRCFLRRGVVEKLALVQRDLNAQGLGLKIWDGYRPRSVQWEFWKVLPDSTWIMH